MDDRSRRYHVHTVTSEAGGMRTVTCTTGRTFTQRRKHTPGRRDIRNANGTATWVGRCPGCHAERMRRYRKAHHA